MNIVFPTVIVEFDMLNVPCPPLPTTICAVPPFRLTIAPFERFTVPRATD